MSTTARKPGTKQKTTPTPKGEAKRKRLVTPDAGPRSAQGAKLALNKIIGTPAEVLALTGEQLAAARKALDEFGFTDPARRAQLESDVQRLEDEHERAELAAMPPSPDPVAAVAETLAASENNIDVEAIDVTDAVQIARMRDRETERLARQIRAAGGLLHPIAVRVLADSDRYELIWGARRLAAHRLNGSPTIGARVFPESTTDDQVAFLRTLENFGRKQLTPVAECLAVADCLDSIARTIEGESTAAAIALQEAIGAATFAYPGEHEPRIAYVGQLLGRSPAWVRDRAYVAKLGGRARELLAAARLDLAHARHLAKLGDATAADEIAEQAARALDGTGGRSPAWVSGEVMKRTRDLSKVPWNLTIAFGEDREAGCAGWACETCPHNAVTQPLLFGLAMNPAASSGDDGDAQADEMVAGICTNARCFDAKMHAVEKLVQVGLKKIAKQRAAGQVLRATPGDLAPFTPPELKPAAFAKEVRRADVESGTAADVAKLDAAPGDNGKPSPKKGDAQIAKENAAAKLDAWAKRAAAAVCKAIDAKPGRRMYFAAMREANKLNAMKRTGDAKADAKADRVATSPELRAVFKRWGKPELKDLIALEKQSPHKAAAWVNEIQTLTPAALAAIADALSVKIDEPPAVEVGEGK